MFPLVDEESVAGTKKPACGGQAGQYREVGASTRCLESRRGAGDCKGDTRSPALGRAGSARLRLIITALLRGRGVRAGFLRRHTTDQSVFPCSKRDFL